MERPLHVASAPTMGSLAVGSSRVLVGISHFIQVQFLWLLLAFYLLAAFFPAAGLWMREVTFAEIHGPFATTSISLPVVMLAFLLFNAGLAVKSSQLRELGDNP